ncbi:MAG TPA: tetratricopeptide repeat protein [Candidatus Kapabacteria bacterium]|nr:tetratricopeptide repeat protein [Candidatus Kapabacteria bacterium]
MKVTVRSILKTALALCVVLVFGSCTFFRGFATYFNIVYLAQKHLDAYEELIGAEATTQNGAVAAAYTHHWMEEELLSYKIRRREGPPISAFLLVSKPKVSILKGAASSHLDSAVILGSKVLADPKPTKYVEDALFIVGKALYYKNDYAGAKRKFYELLYKYPDTHYADETGMLLAETLVSSGQPDSATASLETILKKESGKDKQLRSEIHKTFADLLVSSSYDSYEHAAAELKTAEDGISGNALAQMEYDRGRLFFVTEHWSDAEDAFRNASAATNDNTFKGEALAALGETLRREQKYDEAKATFTEVTTKTRYAPTKPSSSFELAYTTDFQERTKANGNLRTQDFMTNSAPIVKAGYFLLDTAYRNISQAIMARSRFRQAELFREMGQYDSAAHIANIIIGTKDFSTPEMNDFVNNRMRALTRFAEWKFQLLKMDSMEFILSKMRRHGYTMGETVMAELRNDAIKEFIGPKWLPSENYSFTPQEEKKLGEIMEKIKKEKAASGVNVFQIDFSDTVRYIDSLHRSAAHAHFEIGRAYESFDEQPDAAIEYKKALSYSYYKPDTASMALQAQVLYSWVQLDNDIKKDGERDSLIGVLKRDYGETKYALQAALEYGGKKDKDAPSEVAFRNASAGLKNSSIELVKPSLLGVVALYPREDVAPRSLYTIGVYYEDTKKYDSAMYYYYRVVHEYPFSRYTEYLKPRLSYALAEYDKRHAPPKPLQDTTKPAPK